MTATHGDTTSFRTVWEVDTTPVDRRWMRWVLPPAAALIALGLVSAFAVGDTGSASFFIGFGAVLIGLILVGPRLVDFGRRRIKPVVTDGVHLRRGDEAIVVSQIERWDVTRHTMRTHQHGSVTTTIAAFDLSDGTATRWTFVHLREHEDDDLRERLAAVIGTPPA